MKTSQNSPDKAKSGSGRGRKFGLTIVGMVLLCGAVWGYRTYAAGNDKEAAAGADNKPGTIAPGKAPTVASGRLKAAFRDKMTISLLVPGTINTERTTSVINGVDSTSKIIWIVDEGTMVKKGDKLVELESPGLDDRLYSQQSTTNQTQARYDGAVVDMEMQKQSNQSDLLSAQNRVDLADLQLQKYQEGDYKQNMLNRNNDINIAKEELLRANDKVEWTRKLVDKGYVSTGELQSDELAQKKQEIAVSQAENALSVFENFEYKSQILQLTNAQREAKDSLNRVKGDNDRKLRSRQISVDSAKDDLDHQIQRLKELQAQKAACTINAPDDGMVVYNTAGGGGGGGRGGGGGGFGNQVTIDVGVDVNNRQKLIDLPDFSSWQAETRVHESMIRQVKNGQPALITVDALPGTVLHGRVNKISVMPAQANFRSASDVKEYQVIVKLDPTTLSLKPGMTAKTEIVLDNIDSALQVPIQSVYVDDNKNYVMSVQGDQMVRRPIEVGVANDKFVEVTSGLNEGDMVVLGATGSGNLGTVLQRPSDRASVGAGAGADAAAPAGDPSGQGGRQGRRGGRGGGRGGRGGGGNGGQGGGPGGGPGGGDFAPPADGQGAAPQTQAPAGNPGDQPAAAAPAAGKQG